MGRGLDGPPQRRRATRAVSCRGTARTWHGICAVYARYLRGICTASAWILHGVCLHRICLRQGDGRDGEVRGARYEVQCSARCDARRDAMRWLGGWLVGAAPWLCGCAAVRGRGLGEGWWGALNDASALAVGALEPVLDLIALDEGGYQRAHRAHLSKRVPRRVPGRVPGRVPRGDAHSGAAKGCSGGCDGGRGGVAWRGSVAGAERVQQGRSPAGRRVRCAGCWGG